MPDRSPSPIRGAQTPPPSGVPRADVAERLARLATYPVHVSSAGFPYLEREAWELLRDEVPHLLAAGGAVLATARRLEAAMAESDVPDGDRERFGHAMRVVRQIVLTAAITAPPDLWLLRQVLANLAELGLSERLLEGRAVSRSATDRAGASLDGDELAIELRFLEARALVEPYDGGWRIAGHPRAAEVFRTVGAIPLGPPRPATPAWHRLFAGETLDPAEARGLAGLGADVPRRTDFAQTHWIATPEEIELGWRLLPVVLGLRAAERTVGLAEGTAVDPAAWSAAHPEVARAAGAILEAAGWLAREEAGGGGGGARANGDGEASRDAGAVLRVTTIGARGFARAPGPFGIIETYHAYLERGVEILRGDGERVHVKRGANVAASQDANHATFARANDALDRFCADTGFTWNVFIEHAVGRGEATRIRRERSGDAGIRWFGADLEDAAIDAAEEERRTGRLPPDMVFVRRADIGKPEILLERLRAEGCDPRGAVMMVGNGFHEVRGQDAAMMIDVFAAYERAGIVLIFTEENALAVADLRATAWNTYHSGFRYVHERSGQALRPANPRSPERSGHLLRRAWYLCARQAGYVRLDAYSHRTRTVYPYPPRDGHNPCISSTHFCVPARIARQLGIAG